MMKRTQFLGELNKLFSMLETMLENGGKMELLDDNRTCEDIMCRILNDIYGWNLVNLNREQKNYPGIDLGDLARGLGVQVSTDKSSNKVSDTLHTVVRHSVHEDFPHIMVLVLGKKQRSYSLSLDTEKVKLQFSADKDVIDFSDLLDRCQQLKTEKLEGICRYLKYELGQLEEQNHFSHQESRLKVESYMELQSRDNQYITILGLGQKLPIDDVWIQLSLVSVDEIEQNRPKEQWSFLQQYDEYKVARKDVYDVEAVLAETYNMVILAGPGMGKSTLCKKLFWELRKDKQTVLKVRLFDVANYMREGKVFADAICLAMSGATSFSFQKEELDRYFSVLILDGLDECGDLRYDVSRGIAEWGRGHSSTKIIVTSRPIGYDGLELSEYKHYQILPLDDDKLDDAATTLLQVIRDDYQEELQWFQEQMKNYNARKLACRSPLILGFLVQLSIQRKNISEYKVGLYRDIMQVWLEGSSRHNEKRLQDAELCEGVEAIAYYLMESISEKSLDAYSKDCVVSFVGDFFTEELGYRRLKAKGMAENCLEFWTQRGIIEKNYVNGKEIYLFLHLNVGEFLAASYIAKLPLERRRKWIWENYRKNSWHETIRMLIACEKELCAVEELLQIEKQDSLPDGAIFLAADGAAEREKEEIPQELYDKLLAYVQGDNPYLAKKAADGAAKLKGKRIDWKEDVLEELFYAGCNWGRNAAYHIYLALPKEKQDYEVLRRYVIDYCDSEKKARTREYLDDFSDTILSLKEDASDTEVIDALKEIYYEHCSVYEMERLNEYFEKIGLQDWAEEYMARINAGMPKWDFDTIHRRFYSGEEKLVQILAELYGSEKSTENIEICMEYSKLAGAIELMESPVYELAYLKGDLEKKCAPPLLQAAGVATNVDGEKLAKELYVLQTQPADSLVSVSGNYRVKVKSEPHWERTRGMVSKEDIVEGICSRSSIMGDVAMQVAYYNWELEGLQEEVQNVFYGDNGDHVHRTGILLIAKDIEHSTNLILRRILCGESEVLPNLFHLLGICEGKADDTEWLEALKHSLQYGRDTVTQVAKYLQGDITRHVTMDAVDAMLSMVRCSLQVWLKKRVKCQKCKEHPFLNPRGHCPKCNIGGELPTVDLLKVLIKWNAVSLDELAEYVENPLYDMLETARNGIRELLEKNPADIKKCLERIESGAYTQVIFDVVLKLPQELLGEHGMELLQLADDSDEECTMYFLKNINLQNWMPAAEKRKYIEKMLQNEKAEIRSEAMASWLKR